MRLFVFPVMALVGALVAIVSAIDLLAAPKPANPRVRITFTDGLVPDGATAGIQSDGAGPYEDGDRNVTAYIDASTGALNFGTGDERSAKRAFLFSFGACLEPCLAEEATYQLPVGAPYPEGFATGSFQAGVRATDPDNGSALHGALLAMPLGVPMRSGIKINIPLDRDSDFWTICLSPDEGVSGFCGFSDGATPARIIRNAPGQWEIWATSDDVAQLINEVSSRGKVRTIEYLGTYNMPLHLTVDCIANCPS